MHARAFKTFSANAARIILYCAGTFHLSLRVNHFKPALCNALSTTWFPTLRKNLKFFLQVATETLCDPRSLNTNFTTCFFSEPVQPRTLKSHVTCARNASKHGNESARRKGWGGNGWFTQYNRPLEIYMTDAAANYRHYRLPLRMILKRLASSSTWPLQTPFVDMQFAPPPAPKLNCSFSDTPLTPHIQS